MYIFHETISGCFMCTTHGYSLHSNLGTQGGKSVPTPDQTNKQINKQTGRKVVYQTSGYDAHDCWCVKNRTFSPQAASYFFFLDMFSFPFLW